MVAAFLDIETSWERSITIIGIYRAGEGTTQLVAPRIDRGLLLALLEDVETLYTYNGGRFDLPVIAAHLGVQLDRRCTHRDLMFDCWKRKWKGGLKAVERRLGIHRDSEGIDGMAAMRLWAAHERGDTDALETLLLYNKEDCENLEILAWKLGLVPAPASTMKLLDPISENS
ncbi:MAG TPA: ribonuclease H-like domain-containing protein [Elusimicrobiota bacterium]|nr:ribonuclease H-like domain-containing protein [Elusimicrobiota bacterium]